MWFAAHAHTTPHHNTNHSVGQLASKCPHGKERSPAFDRFKCELCASGAQGTAKSSTKRVALSSKLIFVDLNIDIDTSRFG